MRDRQKKERDEVPIYLEYMCNRSGKSAVDWLKFQLWESDLRQRQYVPNVDHSYGRDRLIGSEEFKGFEYAGDLRLIVAFVAKHL